MKEHKILFFSPAFEAIESGKKTQMRLVVEPDAPFDPCDDDLEIEWGFDRVKCPYEVGDRIWVVDDSSVVDKPGILIEVIERWPERLQDISEEDAITEGLPSHSVILNFRGLWDLLNGKTFPWDSNPWVWRIEFKRVETAAD